MFLNFLKYYLLHDKIYCDHTALYCSNVMVIIIIVKSGYTWFLLTTRGYTCTNQKP